MESQRSEPELTRVLQTLRAELADDLELLRGAEVVSALGSDLDDLLSDLDQHLERVTEAAVITLVGSTGAGKSTLLNSLVGVAVAEEGETRPTTSAPVIYRPVDADVTELVDGLPGGAPRIVDYDPSSGGPWRGQILVDAPDVNSVSAEHRDVVKALAGRSDVLLVVCHRQSISELAAVEFVDLFAGRRRLVFVLNRSDELTEAARSELLEQLLGLARDRWSVSEPSAVALSARQAREGAGGPGWAELNRTLRGLVEEGRLGRVRRLNALGTAERLGLLFGELASSGFVDDLGAAESMIQSGFADWRERVGDEILERLKLRSADLRALLWNEAARRWDGPGGWALRVGGLASLGLGAGAMLARRNPLVAAGAAVGGLALQKARTEVRERGVRDTSGLLPGPLELESIYHATLGSARICATRITGDPEGLGLPGARDLGNRAVAGVEEAWVRLLERDLPGAAEKGVRPWLRWLIDLPVYAMGAWVVWLAIVGFFTADYVGIDLIVNAGLVLLAWLYLGRVITRASLAGRVRALTATVQLQVQGSLAASAESSAEPALAEISALLEALKRSKDVASRWRSRILAD